MGNSEKGKETADKSIFGGVGFGRFIVRDPERHDWIQKVPGLTTILLNFWDARFWIYGDFLTIGEGINADIASQVRTAQSNIALIAALWITVQFNFIYQFPLVWDSMRADSYIASILSDRHLELLHDFFVGISLISLSSNTVACLYSVLIIIVLGEFSSQEMNYVNLKLSRWLNASFNFLFLGIATWSVKALIYQAAVCSTLSALIVTVVVPTCIMGFFIFMAGVLLKCSYEVKCICCTETECRNDRAGQVPAAGAPSQKSGTVDSEGDLGACSDGKSHIASPLFVSYSDVLKMLKTFCEKSDQRYLSEDVFTAYVTQVARARLAETIKCNADLGSAVARMELVAVAALELCELSKAFARKAAADCLSAQLAAAVAAEHAGGQKDAPLFEPAAQWRAASRVVEPFGWN